METVFRIFLANSNQPLTSEEIYQQLNKWRGENLGIDPGKLERLLTKDQFYGLRPVSHEQGGH
jgi:hypothetical protein